MEDPASALRSLRDALKAGIQDVDDFTFRLSSTLDVLGLAPPGGASIVVAVSPSFGAKDTAAVTRYLPAVQQALVGAVPTFLPALDTRGHALLDAFFAPQPRAAPLENTVALAAYLSLSAMLAPNPPTPLAVPAREFVLDTLSRLTNLYSVDALYTAVFGRSGDRTKGKGIDSALSLMWDDAVRSACSVPAKVANAVGRWKDKDASKLEVPSALVPRAYFDRLSARIEGLTYTVAQNGDDPAPLRLLLEKLVTLGLLTPTLEPSPAPALLPGFLPRTLEHLHPPALAQPYPDAFFPSLLLPLAPAALTAFAAGFLTYIPYHLTPPSLEIRPEERVRRAATVLAQLLGPPVVGGEAWTAVLSALLKKGGGGREEIQNAQRRMVVAWVGTGGAPAAKALIDAVMDAWGDPKHIRFGSYSHQFNLTHTLVLSLSLLPPMDPHLVAVSHRGRFLHAVQAYLSHPDGKIRRLGMLVAEIISELTLIEDGDGDTGPSPDDEMDDLKAALEVDDETGEPTFKAPKPPRGSKRLKFGGMWDGTGDGREECRLLRLCVGLQDGNAILSPDSGGKAWMLGWEVDKVVPEPAPATAASNPPQPARAERGRKPRRSKPQPKVVMLDDDQLADPLQGYESARSSSRSPSPTPEFLAEITADPSLAVDAAKKRKLKRPVYVRQLAELLREKDKPDSIEMALQWGEGLVRAKRNFGGEVTENAVAVAAAAIGLADPFKLDKFEERRQGLLTALVACSPRNVPPYLAEQYFSASYSLLQKSVMLTAISMGARELAGLYVPDAPRANRAIDFPTKTLPPALHARYVAPEDTPIGGQLEEAVAGMRNLLLSKGAKQGEDTVPELGRERRLRVGVNKRRKVPDGVVEVDSMDASSQQPPVEPYTAVAAEYFILPLVNRFWDYFQEASVRESRAIGLGARYRGAGTGLVLSPPALEKFLLTLALLVHAARHAPTFLAVVVPTTLELAVTVGARHPAAPDAPESEGNDAHVVAAALDLALAGLDAAVDLDKGRTLAVDAPQLVLATGEWASAVFSAESGGGKVAGGAAGRKEGRVRAASAGVLVKVAEIGEKWGAPR